MMRGWRPVLLGFSMAVLSIVILGGSLLLSLVEGGSEIAEQPTASFTMTSSPVTTQFIIPGRPTRTATSTSFATDTLTPTFVPPSACPPPEGWVAIVVLPDDTLSGLASIYQADEETLAYGNCLEPGVTTLQAGVVFYVPRPSPLPSLTSLPPTPLPSPTNPTVYCGPPPGWVVYIVQYGDTLSNLSQRLNISVSQLRLANCFDLSAYLYAGQALFVPFLPPVIPPQPPPPPATQPFLLTPVYTYPAPPSSMKNHTPKVANASLPSAAPTNPATLAPTATDTPSAYLFYGFPIFMEGWSE